MLSARAGSAEGGTAFEFLPARSAITWNKKLRADFGRRHIADFIEHDHVAAQPTRQHTLHRIVLPGFDRT